MDLGKLADDREATRKFLASCRNKFDLIVSSGSVSVGDRDYLKPAFKAADGQIKSWKVAVKPGKPVMFGKLGRTIFTGLPGNPFAAFVAFNLFVRPQLLQMSGQKGPASHWRTAKADFAWNRKTGRTEIFPVRYIRDEHTGEDRIVRLGNAVSATLFPLAEADGLARVPPECGEVRPGDQLHWHSFTDAGA